MKEIKDHTLGWILLLVVVGVYSTVASLLARESMNAALTYVWAPVAIGGTYLLGKRAGRSER